MRRWKVVVAVGLAVGALGCGEDDALPRGEVLVSWSVGTSSCAERGLQTVEVVLGGGTGSTRPTWSFLCDAGEGLVPNLEPDTYSFALFASDLRGERRYTGELRSVTVRPGGTTQTETVVLRPTPARLAVTWNFGGPLCGQVGVDTVHVLFSDSFDVTRDEAFTPCEEGEAVFELPPGQYRMRARALSETRVELDRVDVPELVLNAGDVSQEEVVFDVPRVR
jgi:hypothetical protein